VGSVAVELTDRTFAPILQVAEFDTLEEAIRRVTFPHL
jgi:acyl-CoA reductase-like NAD-dependent aldehyde dehydrogenase